MFQQIGNHRQPGFPDFTAEDWLAMAKRLYRLTDHRKIVLDYDLRIAEPFRAAFADKDVDLWPLYEQIKCPTLVIRGALSDLLTRDTWQKMASCGPRAKLAEIEGVGHAPMFQSEDQIAVVRDFLLSA